MPIRNDSDLARITSDLARCQEKIKQMEAGACGQIPTEYRHINAGVAQERNLQAQRNAQERLENEFVDAMRAERLWSASAIIAAMEQRK